jgi:iron complex outermembrane recepter protein
MIDEYMSHEPRTAMRVRRMRRVFEGRFVRVVIACGAVVPAVCAVKPARAADDIGLAEIVVTAQRRAENVSDVPLAISAVTGAQLMERNYTNLEDFKGTIPGLQVSNYLGSTRINIRGIGGDPGSNSEVALSYNGVYIGNFLGADQSFLDLERLEVLRGPQGTLYGRNATGGVVNIISKRPTQNFEGYGELTYGDYDRINAQFVASGPLIGDWVLGRIAVGSEDHRGYSPNLADGRSYDDTHSRAFRGTLTFNIKDNVTLDVIADYSAEVDGSIAYHLAGESPGNTILPGVVLGGHTIPLDANGQAINPRLLNQSSPPNDHLYASGLTATLTWNLNDQLSVKSITAYRKEHSSFTNDFDQTEISFPGSGVAGADFIDYKHHNQFSQELQLTGAFHRINFVGGLYYFHESTNPSSLALGDTFTPPQSPVVVPTFLGGSGSTNAYAVFGQATARITDQLNFTAGLRFTHETTSASGYLEVPAFGLDSSGTNSASYNDVSPKATLDYHWTPELMTYLTASKGFKSGGFNLNSVPTAPFQAEKLWDYEAGTKLKTAWGLVDASVFYYDYSNLQTYQIVSGIPTVSNAGSATDYGAELAFTIRPLEQLTVTTALSYINATFDRNTIGLDTLSGQYVSLEGKQLPGASKYTSNLTARYEIPIGQNTLAILGEWNWRSRMYFTELNYELVSQKSVSTFNASARYMFADDRWYVEAYGKNLSDALVWSSKEVNAAGFADTIAGGLDPPRTFGVTVHYKF